MSRPHHPSKARAALIAAVLLVTSLAGAAPVAATRANPQELWDAYPLDPGRSGPPIRLPADSATPPPKVRASATPAEDDGGGASAPLLAGVGIAALAFGAMAGRWLRRPRTAAAPATTTTTTTAPATTTAPKDAPTPAHRSLPPSPAPSPAPRAPAPPSPAPSPAPRAPAPPSPALRASAPTRRPAPAPPRPPAAALAPRPSTGRFRRVAWPDGAEARWRCEVVRHYGVFHADFRAMALEPGQRRSAEIARTPTFPRPGWGTEEPYEKLAAKVQALALALREAGWEPVGLGREWFAVRFVWPHASAPVLELPTPVPTKEHRS
jgi:hypothetical protein